ncbi:SDR family oxidoreductase [Nocardia sp. ET3-3]|uniref:SDR family oxidoreductase n=1 Tax=Nocardia terrae TaxID=2675851 RepID=A0A7K1UP60_9NOCA|nr:SDR family oxidoreductase [Nocardia terrae]
MRRKAIRSPGGRAGRGGFVAPPRRARAAARAKPLRPSRSARCRYPRGPARGGSARESASGSADATLPPLSRPMESVRACCRRPPSSRSARRDSTPQSVPDMPVAAVMSAAARRLAEGRAIVNPSSTATRTATPCLGVYLAAKSGVETLTRVAAKEFGPRRIRVNAVAPGLIDSPMFRDGKTEEDLRRFTAQSPPGPARGER